MSANTFSPMLQSVARKVLPTGMRRALKRWFGQYLYAGSNAPTSYGCEILQDGVHPELLSGWQDPLVAERQDAAFAPLLWQMREGRPREDFVALAEAVRLTDAENPLIVEVGCGSAWKWVWVASAGPFGEVYVGSPQARWSAHAFFIQRWRSASQVYPMAPWTCIALRLDRYAASLARAFAIDTSRVRVGSRSATDQAAR